MNDLTVSTGRSRKDTNFVPRKVTWEQLCARLKAAEKTPETLAEYAAMTRDEKADTKDRGGFVGGHLEGGSRRSGSVTNRQLLCLDADWGSMDLWDTWQMLTGCAAVMHSTHSSTPEQLRLRLIVPLSRPVSAMEYEPIARRVAEWLNMEAFDDTTYEPNRLMFWPTIPKDAEYIFRRSDGPWLDPDEVLASYEDWHDMRSWPTSSRQQRAIKRMGEKQGNPLEKPGIIGAFNRAYSVTAAIERFLPEVYTPCGESRWTYTQGSTVGGAVVYDNDTFLYSHHDTDPVSGRLCNAFDLVRLHLFGAEDEGHGDDLSQAPSQQRMRELCSNDEAVRAELADALRRDPSEVFSQDDGLERFDGDRTEQGAAKDFADQYGSVLRYSGVFGWLFWDGVKWQTDAEAEAKMLMMRYTDNLYGQARVAQQAASDKFEKAAADALMKQAVKLRTSGGLGSLVGFCKAILHDGHPEAYDAGAWDLNTPQGIIDLHTGALRPHDPDARCTKVTAVGLSTGSDGRGVKMWADFIHHITGGDVEFAHYLQVLSGMAAVGEVYEEGLVISYGPGGNGKSTFWGAIRQVLGDYARGINADVLVATAGRTDQSYVAALRGARLAVMGETEEGARFGVAQMKRLTSRDTISARALYKDPIEFKPTHTTIMHTNHLPKLNSLDGGTRRRIAVAPFPAVLPPERVITNFERLLVQECGEVILRWIVEGARMFYNAGCKLVKPPCVVEATEKYLAGEDQIGVFLSECCDIGDGYTVGSGDLYKVYVDWSKQMYGGYAKRTDAFQAELENRGFERIMRDHGRKYWRGLRTAEMDACTFERVPSGAVGEGM